MRYLERNITSIPPRTSLDALRRIAASRIGRDRLPWGVRRIPLGTTAGESEWRQVQAEHTLQKPARRETTKPELLYERGRKIEWEEEIIEDYNGKGCLGIILQFAGIGLTGESFLRSRHDRPGSPVFYTPIGLNRRVVRLFLATIGDILEFQIAPAQMDVDSLFRGELYFPQLTTTYDPASMNVSQNNKLVIVGYAPRAC